jgi:hypothetical protein
MSTLITKTVFNTVMINFKYFSLILPLVASLASGCLLPPGLSGSDAVQPGLLVDFIDGDDAVNETVCMPMRSADITGVVVDGVVEVTITQEFEAYICPACGWPQAQSTQGRYQLPLDEGATVTAFRAEIGGRVVEGIVKDADEAQKDFDEAVSAGKPAFLAEQKRPDVFEISCGNMPANSVVRVILVYVAPLELLDANTYRFVLPTKIAPRYDPRTGSEPIPDLEPLLNTGVKISLGALMSTDIDVSSDTHSLQIIGITNAVTAVEVVDEDPLTRDVVIDFTAPELSTELQVFVEQSNNGTYGMMLALTAPLVQNDTSDGANKEFIFILDRSGSMEGLKMLHLRTAMIIIMTSLHPDTIFNIVGFGSTFDYLFPEGSQLVSDQGAYDAALSYIDAMGANFGGTELLSPIQDVLLSLAVPTHQRNLFVITDGQVSNEAQVIDFVGDNLGSSRVFTLGVGQNVGRNLVNGIARNGDGTSDYVNGDTNTAIVEAVERQIETASNKPSIFITEMEFADVSTTASPFFQASLIGTPIISGRRAVYYFLTNSTAPPGEFVISVRYQNEEGPLTGVKMVPPANFIQTSTIFESAVIHRMAAREQIRDLEEGRSPLHAGGAEPSESEVKDEIVRISVKYQILSSETSFVAIDNFGWTGVTEKAESTDGGGAPTSGGGGFGVCFSGENAVLVRDKGYTKMKDVEIGDMVSIGRRGYSPVYGFGHRATDQLTEYLVLHTEHSEAIEISLDHLIFVESLGAIPASAVTVGTLLISEDGTATAVTKISSIDRVGAFAPFTSSGTIVVGRVLASNYVSLQDQSEAFTVGGIKIVSMHELAHTFQAPRRMICSMSPSLCLAEAYTKDGISTWVYRPFLAAQWLLNQRGVVVTALSIVVLVVSMILYVAEVIFMNFPLVAAMAFGVFSMTRKKKKSA